MSATNIARSPRQDVALSASTGPKPNPAAAVPYRSPAPGPPIDLWLAGNEGRVPKGFQGDWTGKTARADLNRYPSTSRVADIAAEHYGLEPGEVLVTAGADDGLLRVALAFLGPDREAILPEPTFEMVPRYAALAGATVRSLPWAPGTPFPTEAVIDLVSERTAVIFVVSPNNPTGSVAAPEDLTRIAEAAPNSLVVLDAAYGEFAENDLMDAAKTLPNVITLRTLSKAYGCAGLRVGFALGAPPILASLAAAGNPYPCAAPSLAGAAVALAADPAPFVQQVKKERTALVRLLRDLGLPAATSHGNFVYAETPAADTVRALISGLGIAIRTFGSALRITCPGNPRDYARLEAALRTTLRPGAILFDMDGVLADVSGSYRRTILETAKRFGAALTDQDIDSVKARGGANDDWQLTWRLIRGTGIQVTLEEVTATFEEIYQGAPGAPGLRRTESLLLPGRVLAAIAQDIPLGIVTGRPRSDANAFLDRFGIRDLFGVVIAREDAELKPSPAPTRLAMEHLDASSAWLLGDTPDDVRSARSAGALPVGALPPSDDPVRSRTLSASLTDAGAGLVLESTGEITDLLASLPSR